MDNVFYFNDYVPGVKVYTPEMGDRKPVCKMEARLAHYGKHYFIDTTETLQGRGIEFLKKYAKDHLKINDYYKTGWNAYMVTLKAFELLKNRYPVAMEILLD